MGAVGGYMIIEGNMGGVGIALLATLALLLAYLLGLILTIAAFRVVKWWLILIQLLLPPIGWYATVWATNAVPRMRAKATFESRSQDYEKAANWVLANPPKERLVPQSDTVISVEVDLPSQFDSLGVVYLREYDGLRWIEFQGPPFPVAYSTHYTFCRIVNAPPDQRDHLDLIGPNWFLSTESGS